MTCEELVQDSSLISSRFLTVLWYVAFRRAFAKVGRKPLFFETHLQLSGTQHAHIQVIPVPGDANVKDAVMTQAKADGVEFAVLGDQQTLGEALGATPTACSPYVAIELPGMSASDMYGILNSNKSMEFHKPSWAGGLCAGRLRAGRLRAGMLPSCVHRLCTGCAQDASYTNGRNSIMLLRHIVLCHALRGLLPHFFPGGTHAYNALVSSAAYAAWRCHASHPSLH